MNKILTLLGSVLLIIVIVITFYFVHKYSYIETIEISVFTDENEYMLIEPYRYDINKIKKYFMISNTLISQKTDKEIECIYKVNINDHDLICYDGNDDYLATYSRRIDTVDDVKEKIKKKNVKAIGDDKYEVKTFKMNKDFAKMLVDLY